MSDVKNLARIHLEKGCELYERKKLSLAVAEFKIAAKLGDANAQLNLANMLDAGEGVRADRKLAVFWYKRAIRLGSSQAAYNLAISHKANGTLRWYKYWLHVAMNMGDGDAGQLLHKELVD